jgi:hypothetical protein
MKRVEIIEAANQIKVGCTMSDGVSYTLINGKLRNVWKKKGTPNLSPHFGFGEIHFLLGWSACGGQDKGSVGIG